VDRWAILSRQPAPQWHLVGTPARGAPSDGHGLLIARCGLSLGRDMALIGFASAPPAEDVRCSACVASQLRQRLGA
jgi:hypothetical protein